MVIPGFPMRTATATTKPVTALAGIEIPAKAGNIFSRQKGCAIAYGGLTSSGRSMPYRKQGHYPSQEQTGGGPVGNVLNQEAGS